MTANQIDNSMLNVNQRQKAMMRFEILKPHLENNVTLTQIAHESCTSLRTLKRWLSKYRENGLSGLIRVTRSDSGNHKLPSELIKLIEGMALHKPKLSVATIYRRLKTISKDSGYPSPSYASIYDIIHSLNPAMVTLAQDGNVAFRNQFELIYRHRAEKPNAIWQADHTELDILILDSNGTTVRPWLTVIIDDYSRVIAGYMVFVGAPSALQTSLALRQAIWRKQNPDWIVCGIPEKLYVDHGSDFTSLHLEQVAADLRFQLIHSTVARPQGRGKIERFFGTLNTELLPELAGHLKNGKLLNDPKLSLHELDLKIESYIVSNYNQRLHSEINAIPLKLWLGNGWLPNMPTNLEELDMLLIMVAKNRIIRRDGIHFQGLRYMNTTLAAYVGESVTIRYDPRDLAEIRVFYQDRFLCRAIDPKHSGVEITLKDIQTARAQHRKNLTRQINERIARVTEFENLSDKTTYKKPQENHKSSNSKLLIYSVDH